MKTKHRCTPQRRIALVLVALLCGVAPAWAVDGIVEINQAAALEGGVTLGDTPGFPVTIDTAGSYRLTGNLTVLTDVNGIEITTDKVTLDLNGFAITGPAALTSTGILMDGSTITIKDGTVQRFGGSGIDLLGSPTVNKLHRILRVDAVSNGDRGIRVGYHSLIQNCGVLGSATGITAEAYSIVSHNAVSDSSNRGIQAVHCTISGNTVTDCDNLGIDSTGSMVSGNTVYNNHAGVHLNEGLAIDNLIRSNSVYGLNATSASTGYARNNINGNGTDVVGSGTQIGTNLCGTTTCP